MRYSRNWEQNTMLEKGRVCMKDREELLKEIALMLERQDMLSKLTENQCLDEYGYSETLYRLYRKTGTAERHEGGGAHGDDAWRDQQDDQEASCQRADRKIYAGDEQKGSIFQAHGSGQAFV